LKTTRPLVLDLSVFFVLDLSATIQSYLSRVLMNESSGNYSAVGIFSLSLQIIQIGSLFSGIITNISRPQFAKLAGSKDELLAFFNQITRINCYIAIPFLMAFIVQAPNVLSLFGQSYTEYPYMLIFLGIAYLVLNISGPIGTMLIMCGHEKMELLNTGASLLIYFILGFSLSHVTIYGLTIAILGMNIVSALTKIIEACKIFKRSPYSFKDILFIALLICLSGIIFLNLSFITSTTRWLIANVLVGSLTIVLFFVLTPYKNDKYFFFSKK
jgi:O-antigen/teichoic acid export membrane protein